MEYILPKCCQFDWFIRLGLLIILHFDFIIDVYKRQLLTFCHCSYYFFTNPIYFPSVLSFKIYCFHIFLFPYSLLTGMDTWLWNVYKFFPLFSVSLSAFLYHSLFPFPFQYFVTVFPRLFRPSLCFRVFSVLKSQIYFTGLICSTSVSYTHLDVYKRQVKMQND